MTSNTVASVSVGLVSAEASVLAVVAHTIIRVDLTPGVKLVLDALPVVSHTCSVFFSPDNQDNQVRLEHM